jgi:hypothetical protein
VHHLLVDREPRHCAGYPHFAQVHAPRYPRASNPTRKAPTATTKLIAPFLVLAVLAVILAGCGSGGSSSSSSSTRPTGGKGANGISVGNCLNDEDFLVQPNTTSVDGQSPAGVSFTLTFYKDVAAAKAVLAKKNPKTTALVENGVVDFHGNVSPYKGAPPAKISKVELVAIKTCIDTANKG